MGDISSAAAAERQFIEDLERAKRLSLECYETEKSERLNKMGIGKSTLAGTLTDPSSASSTSTTNGRRLSQPTTGPSTSDKLRKLEITPRPRPYSRGVSSGPAGTILSPPPSDTSSSRLTSIPPPHPFKRHRSLPYRHRHPIHPPVLGEDYAAPSDALSPIEPPYSDPTSASDDLIFLASPKVTPKHFKPSLGAGKEPNTCDTPTSNTNATIIPNYSIPIDSFPPPKGASIPRNPTPGPTMQFNPPVRPGPAPITPGTTSTVIGSILSNISKGVSPNGQPLYPHSRKLQAIGENRLANGNEPLAKGTASGSNLYKRVSDDLRSMNLIDFGAVGGSEERMDSKNILEYFDPLVIRESQEREAVRDRDEREVRARMSEPNSSASEARPESVYNDSTNSCTSTATSAFSYRGSGGPASLSLYPSLEEFEAETLYGNLGGSSNGGRFCLSSDASSFYDVYNPFEYLYTVSCSTPSAAGESLSNINSQQQHYASVQGGNGGTRPIGFCFNEQAVAGTAHAAPALPPRNSELSTSSRSSSPTGSVASSIQLRIRSQSYDRTKRIGKLYENIENIKNFGSTDSEIQAFYDMLREVRFSCRHVDSTTNKGYIRSPILETKCTMKGLSLKIMVWPETVSADPVGFTCDISASVELVLEQSIMEHNINGSGRDYMLRVKGLNEYLEAEVPLADYCYVQQCVKLDEDIQLVLAQRASIVKSSWARTSKDDAKSVSIQISDILPEIQAKTINYKDISIPLELIDRESDRIKDKLNLYVSGVSINNNGSGSSGGRDSLGPANLSPALLIQPVKAVCVLLGEVVTVEIVNSLDLFLRACDEWNNKVKLSSPVESRSFDPLRRAKIGSDVGNRHSVVEILPNRRNSLDDSIKDFVSSSMDHLTDSVRSLVEMYSKSFPVSFRMKEVPDKFKVEAKTDQKPMSEIIDTFIIRIGAIHRLKPEWINTYTSYMLYVEVFNGTRWMGRSTTPVYFLTKAEGHCFFNTIVFDTWINFEHLPICILPRECRVVFRLCGHKPDEDSTAPPAVVELCWASMQCFNFKGLLAQGNYLLPFWPEGLVQKRLGPAPNSSFSSDGNSPLLTIAFTDFGTDMLFPEIPISRPISRDFKSLDSNTQLLLKDIIDQSTFTKFPPEDLEILWEKRHYLRDFPAALPKVLLAAQLWDWASLAELHAMLQNWRALDPVDSFELLLPCFPDARVREAAIRWISHLPDEELINLLPQLVEALSYETFDLSPLATFLLRKSLSSIPFSHNLFWMLASQVGLGKWTTQSDSDPVISRVPKVDAENTYDPKRRRLELMLNSLMTVCGERWRNALISQFKLIEGLSDTALIVKGTSKDSARTSILWHELQKINENVFSDQNSLCSSFPLPTSPSSDITAIHPNHKMCSYYNSNAMPLKITFLSGLPESGSISTIFKLGDDLRQDMLTIQTIRLIEKWWLKDGLDLRVLTFSCIPTGYKQGMVEMVPNAETLCKIQAEYGVTGVFRDSAIAEWLAKMNPSTLDYQRAIDNFTLSCAAYCVLTYVLGICDRHNDNIMLTKRGHLFHIDFGKFLGDAQMFINFKRDRTPFVLTSDMVYVINDGEKGSHRFHRFIELCCTAFRIIRKNSNILLNLFTIMATAGIPGVDINSVTYIQRALLPDCSNVEAAARFTRFIEESSQNWFTPVNFFLHSLAQLRFSSDNTNDNPTTLSFVPNIYKMEEEGRIEKALVVSCQKIYDPEKYYSYTIKVKRRGQADWALLHRSYKEFQELHGKLCLNFPMAVGTLKSLPRGSGIGRTNIKQVAEKRRSHIQLFLESLFMLADEISHSNLVYTFFHPLLRDEEQHLDDEYEKKMSARASLSRDPSRIHGQLKLSLVYQRGALLVLVGHAVDLACPNGQPPSPYVKTYLRPDNSRLTKRKTPVVRRSKHPSFMELLEYRLPMDIIRQKVLQVSIWHHDSFQENNFLGGISIPLAAVSLGRETTETYTLGNLTM